jgi:dihydrofolate reductase
MPSTFQHEHRLRCDTVTRLNLIVARARNGVIGNRGAMPWHLPEDLAHFKRTTLGHCIVMGRKTWDAIGRPLPGRRNIVVTRNRQWQASGAQAVASLDEALAQCAGTDVFVIGGGELYAEALRRPVAHLYLTEIDADFDGDAVFPALEAGRWRERSRERVAPTALRPFGFDFVHYEAAKAAPIPSVPAGGKTDVR